MRPLAALCALLFLAACQEPAPEAPPATAPAAGTAPAGGGDAAAAFEAGNKHLGAGKFAAAAEAFSRANALDSTQATYPYHLGIALQLQGRFQEAGNAFGLALAQDPDHLYSLIAFGKMIYDVQGDTKTATNMLKRALEIDSTSAEARYSLGLVLAREGFNAEAIPHLARVAETEPGLEQVLTELGMAHLQEGELEAAEKAFRRAIGTTPHDPKPYFGMSQVAMRQGRTQLGQGLAARSRQLQAQADSLQVYSQMVQAQPRAHQAHYNLAVRLARYGRTDQARQHYGYALALDSTYALAHMGLGALMQREGATDRAFSHLTRAVAIDPSLHEAHNNLGLIHHSRGELDEAVAAYRQAIAHDPQSAYLYSNLGNAYRDQRLVDEAEEAARKALELQPRLPGARELMADVQALRGDIDGAIAGWEALAAEHSANKPLVKKLSGKIERARTLQSDGKL